MSGKGRLDRDLSSFWIANFTDHNNIRVLTKDSSKPRRKRHTDLAIDLRLANAVQRIFNGVFNCQDVARAIIKL